MKIYINGGRRGYLVEIDPGDLVRLRDVKTVELALDQ
jgi:prolyl-tRNA editing enzyme YbaK/EbsC (Cys-tRNA(Pro) deacylase)